MISLHFKIQTTYRLHIFATWIVILKTNIL